MRSEIHCWCVCAGEVLFSGTRGELVVLVCCLGSICTMSCGQNESENTIAVCLPKYKIASPALRKFKLQFPTVSRPSLLDLPTEGSIPDFYLRPLLSLPIPTLFSSSSVSEQIYTSLAPQQASSLGVETVGLPNSANCCGLILKPVFHLRLGHPVFQLSAVRKCKVADIRTRRVFDLPVSTTLTR